MPAENPPQGFTEKHHALLFACVVRAVVQTAGEERGEAVIRKAVRRYGEERGGRMAQRAQANGHQLNMGNYLTYSEYRTSPGGMEQKIVEKVPHARVCISRCSWHTTWVENDLLPYGRLYCLEIDEAVVRGFNPALMIEVRGTKTNGAEQCDFVFHDANLTLLNTLSIGYKKTVRPGKKAVMPWEYHTAHLFAALEKTVAEELGESGRKAVEEGLADFAARCGAQAAQTVQDGRSADYTSVPEIPGSSRK